MMKAQRDFMLYENLSFNSLPKHENGLLKMSTVPVPPPSPADATSFEFGGRSPASPAPADVLFSNGQLQPHAFPLKGSKPSSLNNSSRMDSLSSSNRSIRSNSSSSRSWGNSSSMGGGYAQQRTPGAPADSGRVASKEEKIMTWDHFADAVPSLVPSSTKKGVSRRARVAEAAAPEGCRVKKEVEKPQGFFGTFVSACKQCQVIEPEKNARDNKKTIIKVET